MKKIFPIILFLTLTLISNLFATITFTPVSPNVEQEITFTVSHPDGIGGNQVLWDMGDGSAPFWYGPTVIHAYMRTGTFPVKVNYRTLKQESVTEQVRVTVVENRRIKYSPLRPAPNHQITFTAENFLSRTILWDFGDGSKPQCLGTVVNHIYTATGRYIVKAKDWCGNSQKEITTQIEIAEETGPRAPFQISYIQLRFDDGKPYRVVSQNAPLVAYADIKYEGTGILQAIWLVDGLPFKQVTLTLPYARETVINSGEIPGLPTNFIGLHEVTLKLINPVADFEVPVIRYYVTPPVSGLEIEKRLVTLTDIEIFDSQGNSIKTGAEAIKAPEKGGILIKAGIKLEENLPADSICLLRVYLNNQLVDEQVLRNLRIDSPKVISSSINDIPPEAEKIYLTVYDISRKPPRLLSLKRIDIVK